MMKKLFYTAFFICTIVTCSKLLRPLSEARKSEKPASEACRNVEDSMVALIQAEITVHTAMATLNGDASNLQYPESLDDAQDGPSTSINKFFTKVIDGGVEGGNWSKSGNEYFHTCGDKTKTFFYNRRTGTFENTDHKF